MKNSKLRKSLRPSGCVFINPFRNKNSKGLGVYNLKKKPVVGHIRNTSIFSEIQKMAICLSLVSYGYLLCPGTYLVRLRLKVVGTLIYNIINFLIPLKSSKTYGILPQKWQKVPSNVKKYSESAIYDYYTVLLYLFLSDFVQKDWRDDHIQWKIAFGSSSCQEIYGIKHQKWRKVP